MKYSLILAFLLLMGVEANAQQHIENRQVEPFSSIELVGNLSVTMIPSDTIGVSMVLTGAEHKDLEWSVNEGVLRIHLRPGAGSGAGANVKLYYNACTILTLSAAQVLFQQPLETEILDLNLTAGALVNGTLLADDVLMKMGGNSVAELEGEVRYFTLEATSRSVLNCLNLEVMAADVKVTSGSEVRLSANERLNIVSETGSKVFYEGDPIIFRSATRMMGIIENIGQ